MKSLYLLARRVGVTVGLAFAWLAPLGDLRTGLGVRMALALHPANSLNRVFFLTYGIRRLIFVHRRWGSGQWAGNRRSTWPFVPARHSRAKRMMGSTATAGWGGQRMKMELIGSPRAAVPGCVVQEGS